MQTKLNKLWAFVFISLGGLLLLAGLAAMSGFLGLPISMGVDLLSRQIGKLAAIFLGLGCGSLAVFHGFGILLDRRSNQFSLPPAYFFWILFGLALGLGNILLVVPVLEPGQAVNMIFPLVFLLGAALPTLAVLALGVRRLGRPATWRDVALMFVTGSTISILVALILEGILPFLAYSLLSPLGMLAEGFSALSFGTPGIIERIFFSPLIVVFLLFTAFQAPIPEEFAKALGPGMLGRLIRNERQAFMVGLASGAGFAILENMLYEGLYAQWHGWSWAGITLLRGFGSILHPLCTAILALALFRARTNGKGWLATVGPAYLLSVGIHTLWNGGFEPLVYLTGLDSFLGAGQSFSLYGTYIPSLLVVYLVVLSGGLWLYFNRLLTRLGRDEEVDIIPALIPRRTLAGLAISAVAVLVPIGAMLGPSWNNIQAVAVGGLPTRTPTITPTITPTPTATLTPIPSLQEWKGTLTDVGQKGYPFVLYIDAKVIGGITGRTAYPDIDAMAEVTGYYVDNFTLDDFPKWSQIADFKNGDRSGSWLIFTETRVLHDNGGALQVNDWFYAHIRENGTMVGVYFTELGSDKPDGVFDLTLVK